MNFTNHNETYINVAGFQCLNHLPTDSSFLSLETCGVQNCAPGHWFGPGKRECYLIHFVCSGKGIYEANGKRYHLSKGDFFVIFPDTEVRYVADPEDPWDYIWVGFRGSDAKTYLSYAGIDPTHLIGKYSNSSFILSFVQQMMLARSVTPYNEMKRTAALLFILATIIEYYTIRHPENATDEYSHHVYLKRALSYINEHFAESIKIADIAHDVGIDRSYLSKLFKQSLGVSPQEYLIQYRMDQACLLLSDASNKIASIATAVGYPDPLAFSKMFRKYKGKSPSDYRKDILHPL